MIRLGPILAVGLAVAARLGGSAVAEPPVAAPASRASVEPDLLRVLGYLEQAMPARIVDGQGGAPIDPHGAPVQGAVADLGEAHAFDPLAYETGVIHDGMLAAGAATGDRRFADFTARRLGFLADSLPYFEAQGRRWGLAGNAFRAALAPASLDDCGAMASALIDARQRGVGPDLMPLIQRWTKFIAEDQFRLPDRSMARRRPQPVTLWADDFYMSIPALVEMGRLTGDARWGRDAVAVAQGMASRLFRPGVGLFTHGWYEDNPAAPDIYWGRANGWALLALERLLDEVPEGADGREAVLRIVQRQVQAVAALQSGTGLWHQLLNRDDSFLETSCSAMFVYGIAHAIDRGWVSPVSYGAVAEAGWRGVAAQIDARGQVENTCAGTTLGGDVGYYYTRPVSGYATHGYGVVLMAGAEMILLAENRTFQVVLKNGVYQFIPKAAAGRE